MFLRTVIHYITQIGVGSHDEFKKAIKMNFNEWRDLYEIDQDEDWNFYEDLTCNKFNPYRYLQPTYYIPDDSFPSWRNSHIIVHIYFSFIDYFKYVRYMRNRLKMKRKNESIKLLDDKNKYYRQILEDAQKDIDRCREKARKDIEEAKTLTENVEKNFHRECTPAPAEDFHRDEGVYAMETNEILNWSCF